MGEVKGLKPCPFCGKKAKMHKRLNTPYHAVVCPDTKYPGHYLYVLFWKEQDAIKAWNRRDGEDDNQTGMD